LHISGAFGATEKLLINIQYWCQIEEECLSQTAFGIPIPKKLSTELWLGTGLIKNRGFGFGIPQGSKLHSKNPAKG
jgi:hypothetical protein